MGTSDGVGFEEIIFTNIDELIIDAGTNDGTGNNADRITIEDGAIRGYVSEVRFDDATVWTHADLLARAARSWQRPGS